MTIPQSTIAGHLWTCREPGVRLADVALDGTQPDGTDDRWSAAQPVEHLVPTLEQVDIRLRSYFHQFGLGYYDLIAAGQRPVAVRVEVDLVGPELTSAAALVSAGLPANYPSGMRRPQSPPPEPCMQVADALLDPTKAFAVPQPDHGCGISEVEWVVSPSAAMSPIDLTSA
ncbi:MAG: hypothetical protein DHS20C19_02120 [Acidimicrobiales bacterium]|nr:MAG: hypothetical protein DHS20C19_02120 [Acidimicrobiales bacterium]